MDVRRTLVRLTMVAALALLLLPSLAGAQSARERFCERNPEAAACKRLEQKNDRRPGREDARCTAAQRVLQRSTAKLKSAKKSLRKASKGVKNASGKKAKAKAKAKRKKAAKRVKSAKGGVRLGKARVKQFC